MKEEKNSIEEKEKKLGKKKPETAKKETKSKTEKKRNEQKSKRIEEKKDISKVEKEEEKEVKENIACKTEQVQIENTEEETAEKSEISEIKQEEKTQKVEPELTQEGPVKKEPQTVKNKKAMIPIIVTTTIAILILLFSVIFALIHINDEKILSGISIIGIDVSNLTLEEANKKIEELTNQNLQKDITLKYEDYETTISGKQFSAKFDVEAAVKEAYNIGKDGNIVVNNYKILFTQLFKKDIHMEFYYDDEALNNKLQAISSKLPGTVKQSSYYIEDEKLIIVKGTAGIRIKENESKEKISQKIQQLETRDNIISIPVEQVEPDKINLAKIREEIYKEPKDAYVSKNPTTVHPHVNGVDFKVSIEEAEKQLKEEKKEYTIPLKITVASKTIKDLGEEAFPDQLATFSTRYDSSNYNRSNNLSLAAKKINGTILMPGEIFSYNTVVGERTIAAGYKEAGAYAGGKVVQDVGGGICQISSTIYNTALLANLEIVDRSNHQFQTSYVQQSRDATVSWGGLDFKFKNNRKYPIKIVSSAQNGVAKVSFYGIKEETEYEVFIQSKVLSYLPYSVKYIEDSSLAEGKEIVEQSGYNGCKSEAYRILKLNGKVVSKTLLSKDTYDPMQKIVRKGTKKVEPKKETAKKDNTAKQENKKKTE